MNDNTTKSNTPSVGTSLAALLVGVIAGVVAAIVTVLIFANTFPTDKNMMPVAFLCAAIAGSICGLGLRRSILSRGE